MVSQWSRCARFLRKRRRACFTSRFVAASRTCFLSKRSVYYDATSLLAVPSENFQTTSADAYILFDRRRQIKTRLHQRYPSLEWYLILYWRIFIAQFCHAIRCMILSNLNEPPRAFANSTIPWVRRYPFWAVVNKSNAGRSLCRWHYWMGDAHYCSGPPVSEMTYTVSSGTLNSSRPIPCRIWSCRCVASSWVSKLAASV